MLTAIFPANGPTKGGAALELRGTNFGLGQPPPIAGIGGTLCSSVKWVSSDTILCVSAPASDDGVVALDVAIRLQGDTRDKILSPGFIYDGLQSFIFFFFKKN